MKKQTISEHYKGRIVAIITMLLVCACMTLYAILNFSEILNSSDDKSVGIIFLVIIFGSCAVLFVSSIVQMIIAIKDYNDFKNKNYVTIIGKVIGFEKNTNLDTGAQINDKPIVYVFETHEKIVLSTDDEVSIGNIYTFNYLKNTKIAEVVNK